MKTGAILGVTMLLAACGGGEEQAARILELENQLAASNAELANTKAALSKCQGASSAAGRPVPRPKADPKDPGF